MSGDQQGVRGFLRETRGQSEAIGVVLLLALTIVGAGAVVAFGATALNDAQQQVTTGSAEHAMTQFDSQASLVAHGETEAQRVQFSGGQGVQRSVDQERGWLNVTIVNSTTDTVETQVMNETLGAVVYENGDTTIAYQGGGVWRQTGNGSVMLSPPEFHYRGTTLTLPLVLVKGDGRLGGGARITRAGPTTGRYPNASQSLLNPLEEGEVHVTVHSDYYEAWGRFFSERTGGQVTIDHPNETVTVTLVTPSNVQPVTQGVAAGSPGDDFDVSGSGGDPTFVDSYNSSAGNYTQTKTDNGTVRAAGDVDMSGNSEIKGNVRSGGAVSMSGGATLTRTAYWTTGFSASGSSSYGDEEQISGVEESEPVDSLVLNEVSSLQSSNDNGDTTAIDGNQLNFSVTNTRTISPSSDAGYYLDEIDMADDQKLIIDTNGHNVDIGIENSLTLQGSGSSGANISVKGSGVVRFYVKDDATFGKSSALFVAGEQSKQLWIYGTENMAFDISNGNNPPRLVGVLYAPNEDSTAAVDHAQVYGGIVAGSVTLGPGAEVHYDEGLKSVSPLPGGASVARITYLHVSTNPVEVKKG